MIDGVLRIPSGLSWMNAAHNKIQFVSNISPNMTNLDLFENKMIFVTNKPSRLIPVNYTREIIQDMSDLYSGAERLYLDEVVGSINIGVDE
jgi:hypothetical protein